MAYPGPPASWGVKARQRQLPGKLRCEGDILELAGQRPANSVAATSLVRLHLSMLGDFQRVVDIDPR